MVELKMKLGSGQRNRWDHDEVELVRNLREKLVLRDRKRAE